MAARTRSKSISRLWGLGIAFLAVCAVYVIRLAVLELNSENIGGHRQDGTTERTVVVQAADRSTTATACRWSRMPTPMT